MVGRWARRMALALVMMSRWVFGGKSVGLARLAVCERCSGRRTKRPSSLRLCWELLVQGGYGRMRSDMVPEAATGAGQERARRGEVSQLAGLSHRHRDRREEKP